MSWLSLQRQLLRASRLAIRNFTTSSVRQPSKRYSTRILQFAGLSVLSGTGYLYVTDDGFSRAVAYYKFCLPRFLHYKYVEYRTRNQSDENIDIAFQELHDRYSPQAEVVCLELRGYYLKSAQLLSTMDNFIPEPYLTWCKKLQNEVPSELEESRVRELLESNLGCDVDSIFEDFCYEPVGVASIGQVYRATLREPIIDETTGKTFKTVAVKLQTPGIEHRFRADITTIKSFCAFAMPHFVPPLDEIENQFKTEFDFLLEAENLEIVHKNITPVFEDKVKIPYPVKNLCTRHVLVMEFLEGEKFLDAIKNNFKQVAKLRGISYEELEIKQLEKIEKGEMESLENQKKRMESIQRFIHATTMIQNAGITLYNWTFGLFMKSIESKEDLKILNLAEIMETVALVHGHQIMVDGCVNGDPHPGNILLLKDGRLGLVDYGQTKHLPNDFRYAYADLILALCEENQKRVCDISSEKFKIKTKYGNPDIGYRAMKFWNDSNSAEVLQGLNVYQFLEMIGQEDPIIEQCEDLIIPSRVSVILRGMGNAFGMDLSMAQMWKPIAKEVLKEGISKGYQRC